MKSLKILLCLCILQTATFTFGQSYELIQRANSDYDKLCNVFIETCGSFFDNANHHANTVKIHDFIDANMSSIKTLTMPKNTLHQKSLLTGKLYT